MILSIVDLDNTLVGTESLKKLRDERKWSEVYRNLDKTIVSDFTENLIKEMIGTDIIVVTSSPRPYAEKVLEYIKLTSCVKGLVTYYDTTKRKPYPDPYIKAISGYEDNIEEIKIYGDEENDFIAAEALKLYLNNDNIKITKIGCSHYKDNNLKSIDEIRR